MLNPKSYRRKNSKLFDICIVIGVAIVYYGAAEISRIIVSAPQGFVPIWPSAGISVAAILILGNRALLGAFIGVAFIDANSFFQSTSFRSIILSTLMILTMALGSALSDGLCAFLIGKTIKNRQLFNQIRDVFKILIFGGIFAPSVNATFGATLLYLNEYIPGSSYLQTWLLWWVAYAVGLFIFMPLLICLVEHFQLNKNQIKTWQKIRNFRHLKRQSISVFQRLNFKRILEKIVCHTLD